MRLFIRSPRRQWVGDQVQIHHRDPGRSMVTMLSQISVGQELGLRLERLETLQNHNAGWLGWFGAPYGSYWTLAALHRYCVLDTDVKAELPGYARKRPGIAGACKDRWYAPAVEEDPKTISRLARICMLVRCRLASEHNPFEAGSLLRFSGPPCLSTRHVWTRVLTTSHETRSTFSVEG